MGHQTTPGAGPSAALAGNLTAAQMDLVIRHLPVQVSVVDEGGTLVYWHGDLFADCELRHAGVHVDESHDEHSRRTIAARPRQLPGPAGVLRSGLAEEPEATRRRSRIRRRVGRRDAEIRKRAEGHRATCLCHCRRDAEDERA